MATVIYLHGFASVGESPKTDAIRAAMPGHTVVAPNLAVDPDVIIQQVKDVISSAHDSANHPIIFVGTSLGGFWANYFAQVFDAPCVLVNPCVNPSEALAKYMGADVRNWATQESITVTQAYLDRYAELEQIAKQNQNGYLVNLFVASDDDVVSAGRVLDYFPFTNSCLVTEDGGHRYEKYWDRVVGRIARLAE